MLDRENAELSAVSNSRDKESLCARLYQSYAPHTLAYLRRHVRTQEDAEDLLLDVFLAALKHESLLAELSEEEHRAWLFTVARNKVFDYHRRARRQRVSPLEEAQELPDKETASRQLRR